MKITQDLDVTRAIASVMPYIRSLTPGLAALQAAVFAALSVVFALFAWYFDYGATYSFISPFASGLQATLPQWVPVAIMPAMGVVITLSPSFIQLFLPGYAKITWVAGVLYLTVVFDAVTDYPRVVEFLAVYKPVGGDIITYGLWHIAHYILLLVATLGFEFMLVLLVAMTMACIGQAAAWSRAVSNGK